MRGILKRGKGVWYLCVGVLLAAAARGEESAPQEPLLREPPSSATPEELLREFAREDLPTGIGHSPGYLQIEKRRPECIPALIAGLGDEQLQAAAVAVLGRLLEWHGDELWVEDHRDEMVRALLRVAQETDYRHDVCRTLARFPSLPEAVDAVPALVAKLGTMQIQGAVIRRIGPAALPKILEHRDANGLVTWGAVNAIRALGPDAAPAVPELIAVLEKAEEHKLSAWRIRKVAYALTAIGPGAAPAVPALVKMLNTRHRDEPDVPVADLLTALGAIGPEATAAVPVLMEMLGEPRDDGPPYVRYTRVRRAAVCLGQIGRNAKAAVPALLGLLEDPQYVRSQQAALEVVVALGRIGPEAKAAAPKFREMLMGEDMPKNFSYQASLAEALWQVTGDADLPIRVLAAQDGDWADPASDSPNGARTPTRPKTPRMGLRSFQERESAMEALGRIGKPAVPALIRRLNDENERVQAAAATALGTIRPVSPEALVALERHAKAGKYWVRRRSIEALAAMGPAAKAALPTIEHMVMNDQRFSSRAAAAVWEISRDANRAVPCLVWVIEHGEDFVQWDAMMPLHPEDVEMQREWLRSRRLSWAATLLGRIGPDAKAALPLLEKQLQDRDPDIRIAAGDAIRRIRGDHPRPTAPGPGR